MDTGFDQAMATTRGRTIVKPIVDGLRSIDVSPDAVEDVIITHLHYDHCGNHDVFPKARFHLQDTEIAYATGRYMCHETMRIPFEVDDVVAMVKKVFAGRDPQPQILLAENGDVITFADEGARIAAKAPVGRVLIDQQDRRDRARGFTRLHVGVLAPRRTVSTGPLY